MEKLPQESVDLVAKNVRKLRELFPECVTEARDDDGRLREVVDFEKLRQALTGEVSDDPEAYRFTWVGKKEAYADAFRSTRKTLRPCPEESRDWNNTRNLYLEGDNLEVLKLLQESCLGRVKMIYIDPPYNTGCDAFVYPDDYTMDEQEYEEFVGRFDKMGNILFKENNASNPRFHSDWCSMIYARLLLARNLLSDDGVIFISIDDNEVVNLTKICDEVFGASCFVSIFSWQRTYSSRNDSKGVVREVEYIVAYSKAPNWSPNKLPRTEEMNSIYKSPDNDPRPWTSSSVSAPGASTHQGMVYAIQHPFTGEMLYPTVGRCWSLGQSQMLENLQVWASYELRKLDDAKERADICGLAESEVRQDVWGIVLKESLESARAKAEKVLKDGNWPYFYFTNGGKGGLRRKTYLEDMGGRLPTNFLPFSEVGHTDEAKKEVTAIFEGAVPFDTPKPVRLLERLLTLGTDSDSLVLDFFSGSATTAHALMKKNAEDGGSRQFIMVQLSELCKSPEYPTICEIGKERIRRAGSKLKSEHALDRPDLDVGFRVFKIDEGNMTDAYYYPSEYSKSLLDPTVLSVKPDRTELDLLFGCLLDWGLPLSLPYTVEQIGGATVHNYASGELFACFDARVSVDSLIAMAERSPTRVVLRESSFERSDEKINVAELFKQYSKFPTRIKTL